MIMLTGIAEDTGTHFSGEEMGDLMGEEPDAYIEEPVEPDVFEETVRNLLNL